MPSDQPQAASENAAGRVVRVHRFEELMAQLEGRGLKRNGHDALLKKAAVFIKTKDFIFSGCAVATPIPMAPPQS